MPNKNHVLYFIIFYCPIEIIFYKSASARINSPVLTSAGANLYGVELFLIIISYNNYGML